MTKIIILSTEGNASARTLTEILEYEKYSVTCIAPKDSIPQASLVCIIGNREEVDSFLVEVKKQSPNLPTIVFISEPRFRDGIELVRGGVYDVIEMPPDLNHTLWAVRSTFEGPWDSKVPQKEEPKKQARPNCVFIGGSSEAERVRKDIKVANHGDMQYVPVLITGDTGVGKEVVACAIHDGSARSGNNLEAINCGAIPDELIESVLFGHEKGAFTGAIKQHIGCFERAAGGTLFLDEIGTAPERLQIKLLRALETGKIVRVGGDKEIDIDVRIMAATNEPLAALVEAEKFRQDLLYRLKGFLIDIPPLSERADDIPILAEHYFKEVYPGSHPLPISQSGMRALKEHGWAGNVRELFATLRVACARAGIDNANKIEERHISF